MFRKFIQRFAFVLFLSLIFSAIIFIALIFTGKIQLHHKASPVVATTSTTTPHSIQRRAFVARAIEQS